MYVLKCGGPPADGGHPGGRRTGGRADTPAGSGQGGAILRVGIHAHAMGEGRIQREPQRGGREDVSTAAIKLMCCYCAVQHNTHCAKYAALQSNIGTANYSTHCFIALALHHNIMHNTARVLCSHSYRTGTDRNISHWLLYNYNAGHQPPAPGCRPDMGSSSC
jgi:hypothetical protein